MYWIAAHHAYTLGYNETKGRGRYFRNETQSRETKEKLSKSARGKMKDTNNSMASGDGE